MWEASWFSCAFLVVPIRLVVTRRSSLFSSSYFSPPCIVEMGSRVVAFVVLSFKAIHWMSGNFPVSCPGQCWKQSRISASGLANCYIGWPTRLRIISHLRFGFPCYATEGLTVECYRYSDDFDVQVEKFTAAVVSLPWLF